MENYATIPQSNTKTTAPEDTVVDEHYIIKYKCVFL